MDLPLRTNVVKLTAGTGRPPPGHHLVNRYVRRRNRSKRRKASQWLAFKKREGDIESSVKSIIGGLPFRAGSSSFDLEEEGVGVCL